MLKLSSGVSAVRVADDVIFLDLHRDAYSVVRDSAHVLQLDVSTTAVAVADVALGAELVEAGLLDRGKAAHPLMQPSPAQRLAAPYIEVTPGLKDVLDFAFSLTCIAIVHRVSALETLVDWAGRGRRGPGRTSVAVCRRAAVFAKLMPLSPVQGDCLFRSHLLLRFLRLGGCHASWVFAARTWPFAAHCWIEVDGVLLNEDPGLVRAFHVVLVV